MPENYHKTLVSALSTLGAAKLTEFVGSDKISRLNELGIEVSASTIADFFVGERGVDVFSDKSLRLELFLTQPREVLLKFLDSNDASLGNRIVEYNAFAWGDNEKSRQFLSLFHIPQDLLEKQQVDRSSLLEVSVKSPLYSYQNWLRKKILHQLREVDQGRFLLHMPTGSGKTRTTLESVCDYMRGQMHSDVTVVWFAHSDELCQQACESMEFVWASHGSEPLYILKLWGGRTLPEYYSDSFKFVVTSFQSAYRMLQTRDDQRFLLFAKIRRKCGILIVDEAHQSTAPTYREAIELFSNRTTKVLGLTATPGRHHVNQEGTPTSELADFYSAKKISIVGDNGETLDNPTKFLTDRGILSKVERYQLNSGQDFELTAAELKHIENQLDIPSSVLRKIGANAARTNLVASHAVKLVTVENAAVIIFAPSKDNAVELSSLLLYSGVQARSITGETPIASRKDSIDLFKAGGISVLVNFGVLTTGFDAPNIDAVIVARPTTSVVLYSQMIGRGLRGPAMGGTEKCKVVDVIDNIINMPTADDAFTYFDEFYG
ncbi:DEAD/DEAH box helicase [Halieaceae bacterium]|nr:DEAD/DEAH box helicase [Halieaceae bacterium]